MPQRRNWLICWIVTRFNSDRCTVLTRDSSHCINDGLALYWLKRFSSQTMRVLLSMIVFGRCWFVDHTLLVGRRDLKNVVNKIVIINEILVASPTEWLSQFSEELVALYWFQYKVSTMSITPLIIDWDELLHVVSEIVNKHFVIFWSCEQSFCQISCTIDQIFWRLHVKLLFSKECIPRDYFQLVEHHGLASVA